jgi:hypothetical protein
LFFSASDAAAGTSDATTFTKTFPFSVYANSIGGIQSQAMDNSANLTVAARWYVTAGDNIMVLRTNMSTGAWTGSGTKGSVASGFYYIANAGE